ncbi:NACHT domain-containing protein [Brasilonema sp. UFV-L1]|uniref:NACHT domain-containing protein n=1 Tax=Brasilonema sp. UFV-L1 TaxID=2234130 RepID=UPI00145DAE96|nr:NACHT domain-containing protein [Brasilonema sp. UFV-L1]NMG10997.1 signal transduction protein [Brasilonema sp. UFV-L1]
MVDFGAIGLAGVKAVIPQVAKVIIDKLNKQFNRTELEKYIKSGITAAKEKYPHEPLLYYEPDRLDHFLSEVLKYSGVQKELEKPLKDEGAPDIPNLIEAFKRVAGQLEITLDEDKLERWISVFADTYFQQTPLYSIEYKNAKEDYLTNLTVSFKKVIFEGIDVIGEDEQDKIKELEEIFVMPNVLEEHKKQDILKQGLHQQLLLTDDSQKASGAFLAGQLLSQSPSQKFVILGEPGSGKSTLMRYFALKLARQQFQELGLHTQTELLPILIEIRKLAAQSNINLLAYLQDCTPFKKIPNGFFDYWLEQGKAVILLDGLDEIADSNKRSQIAKHIYTFFKQERYAQNYVIITSRPAGYKRDFFQTEEFPHYYILPFDEDKINRFIKQWHDSRFAEQESQKWQARLKEVLEQQERIKLLVQNPLLLTIVVLLHRYNGSRLPQRRHKMYEAAVETLLRSWEKKKYPDEESYLAKLKYITSEEYVRRLMESLAYWVHSQGGNGDQDGGTVIDQDTLIKQLGQDIKKLKKEIELFQAEEEAKRLIEHINNRMGLLNEHGQDCYAFVHKTFQEYLCARDIDYQYRNEGDFNIVLDCIKEHLYNPHWREVLLLLIVVQPPKPTAKAIKEILNHEKENEEDFYHNLLFAGNCLAEDPQGLRSEDNELSSEILEQLVTLEVSKDSQIDDKIRFQVCDIIRRLSQTEFAEPALKLLEEKKDLNLISEEQMQQYRTVLGKPRS